MAKGGLGFTLSPTDFLLTAEADYFFTNNFAIGPLLQFGIDDDPFLFAPTVNFKGVFDLPQVPRLKPIVEGGLGLVYRDDAHPDRSETDFLINFGGGFQYFLGDEVALGNEILFNFIPGEVNGDSFFFSWQMLTISFMF